MPSPLTRSRSALHALRFSGGSKLRVLICRRKRQLGALHFSLPIQGQGLDRRTESRARTDAKPPLLAEETLPLNSASEPVEEHRRADSETPPITTSSRAPHSFAGHCTCRGAQGVQRAVRQGTPGVPLL